MQTYFYGGAHLSCRRTDSHAIGIFGQIGSVNGGEDENANLYVIGLEGQWYLGDRATITLQGGYFDADDETEEDVMSDAWFARIIADYYLSQNSKISGEFSYGEGDENSGPEQQEGLGWGVSYQRIMNQHPVAFTIGYRGHKVEDDNSDVVDHTGFVGFTFYLGTNSIFDNDRRGVAWSQPTDLARWVGHTLEVVD